MQWKGAHEQRSVDLMKNPAAGPRGQPLAQITQDPTPPPTDTPEVPTPSVGALLQQGRGGPAEINPAFPSTNTSEEAISHDIPTAEPESNKEMQEAGNPDNKDGTENKEEKDGPSDSESESREGNPIFHTNRDVYRLVQVVLGSVNDLQSQITKLDAANNTLTKEVKQQSFIIFEIHAQLQLLTQELKKRPTAPSPSTTPSLPKQQQQGKQHQHQLQ